MIDVLQIQLVVNYQGKTTSELTGIVFCTNTKKYLSINLQKLYFEINIAQFIN